MMTIPQDGDVIVTRQDRSPVCFTIGRMPASPQFSVATRAEAVRMARTYAQHHLVDIWYNQGDRHRLLETYRMRITTGTRTAPAKSPLQHGPTAPSPFVAAVVSEVEEELRLAARVDVRVLISAADRDVRERCARLVHEGSSRRLGPFVTLHGSKLEGAASGTPLSRRVFERARGGTLFIDDVTQLGVSNQVQLCSWLEEDVTPRGLSVDRPRSSVRIIAGADGQLDHERRSGRFSESLFYRLNLLHINLLRSDPRATTAPTAAVVMSTGNSASS